MRQIDIAIIGGGLAGAAAGAMLGRAGVPALVIDPHTPYGTDFRCEKLDSGQLRLLRKTGLDDVAASACTRDSHIWLARFGRLIDACAHEQWNFSYSALVNAIRGAVLAPAEFRQGKVTEIAASADRQIVTLSDGEQVSARLVVLATGLNSHLRQSLGIQRQELSRTHSVSLGFDIVPVGRPDFVFPSLTYYPERASDRIAYLTLFPVGRMMRANFFAYRDIRDPWLGQMRSNPAATLTASLPNLAPILGAFAVEGAVEMRPVDLYSVSGHKRSGVVLVGDAFGTSCPAAGTGVSKVLTDVERLCRVHIPRWLSTPGMGADKIHAFYDDPEKRRCDADSLARAFFLRSLSVSEEMPWRLRRWLRFAAHWGRGALRVPRSGARRAQALQPATGR